MYRVTRIHVDQSLEHEKRRLSNIRVPIKYGNCRFRFHSSC